MQNPNEVSKSALHAQLPYCVTETDFASFGDSYRGKVRDNYARGSSRIMVTTDRLSCFDRVVTAIPYKGVTLQALALYWFSRAAHIIPHHVERVLDPQIMLVTACEVLPIEVVVRGYLAGSAWRDYEAGRAVSGVKLANRMRRYQKLSEPILTPSTKAAAGDHDLPISEQEIIAQKIIAPALWTKVARTAQELFAQASDEVKKRGLILADTKYEFGLKGGELMLVDEIHTLDSSRYWKMDSYAQRFESNQEPEMLDKEPTRQWLLAQGFKGDGMIPEFTAEHRCAIGEHYINSAQLITGLQIELPPAGDSMQRMQSALTNAALGS